MVKQEDETVTEWNNEEVAVDKIGCTHRIKSVSQFTSETRSTSRVYTHQHHLWKTPLRLDRYRRQMPRNDRFKTLSAIFLLDMDTKIQTPSSDDTTSIRYICWLSIGRRDHARDQRIWRCDHKIRLQYAHVKTDQAVPTQALRRRRQMGTTPNLFKHNNDDDVEQRLLSRVIYKGDSANVGHRGPVQPMTKSDSDFSNPLDPRMSKPTTSRWTRRSQESFITLFQSGPEFDRRFEFRSRR